MKYFVFILLVSSLAIAGNLAKPKVEPMVYEGEVIGFILRDGVRHYEENGKTVYYITAKTLRELQLK